MDTTFYLGEFKKAADNLDGNVLAQKKLEIEVGVWLESVVLRLQKSAWANKPYERPLKGYKIPDREFAAAFRARFKRYEHRWPNVSMEFGPLTLMQGWEKLKAANVQEDVFKIATKFLEIDVLIDDLLESYGHKNAPHSRGN